MSTLTRTHPAGSSSAVPVPPRVDAHGLTITTAIALAAQEALVELAVGDELELLVDPFPAIVPDLQAWCRATGHELLDVLDEHESRRGHRGDAAGRRPALHLTEATWK